MKKGAFQIARQLFESEIWKNKPATWLKIWIYIFGNVNWEKDNEFERGEGFFRFSQEKHLIGIDVTEDVIKKALHFLRNLSMISTTRSTRGTVVKVLKYNHFQTLDNYTGTTVGTSEARQKHDRSTTIVKNIRTKEIKKEINKEKLPYFENWLKYRKSIKKPITNEDTLDLLVKRFNAESIEKVKWTINSSIENNYQGLFWDNYKEEESTRMNIHKNI